MIMIMKYGLMDPDDTLQTCVQGSVYPTQEHVNTVLVPLFFVECTTMFAPYLFCTVPSRGYYCANIVFLKQNVTFYLAATVCMQIWY